MVALYQQAHPPAPRPARRPNPDARPQPARAPHHVWCIEVRYLTKSDGHWRYRLLLFDGDSRALVGAGCVDRQHLSRVVQVCRQAMAPWGAPDAIVRDNAGVLLALSPCLQPLGIHGAPMARGHPWQNLAAGGFSIQRRMRDASVTGCTERESVSRQPAPVVRDDQFWGHGAHTRRDDQGRLYSVSPEVLLGTAKGRRGEARRLRRIFRLRQRTRQVRRYGQIRRHHGGISVEQRLWGQTLDVLIYAEAGRIEPAEPRFVSSPCVYDTRARRLMTVNEPGRQPDGAFQVIQRM